MKLNIFQTIDDKKVLPQSWGLCPLLNPAKTGDPDQIQIRSRSNDQIKRVKMLTGSESFAFFKCALAALV
jgi:hypothetical protein